MKEDEWELIRILENFCPYQNISHVIHYLFFFLHCLSKIWDKKVQS